MIYAQKSSAKRINIYDSELGTETRNRLMAMEADPSYTTIGAYTSDRETHPDGIKPFVAHHMEYLHRHPLAHPEQYLSNLRLQLRVR